MARQPIFPPQKKTVGWVKLIISQLLLESEFPTKDETFKWFISFRSTLGRGQGENSFALKLLEEGERFISRKSFGGKKGMENRWRKKKRNNSVISQL